MEIEMEDTTQKQEEFVAATEINEMIGEPGPGKEIIDIDVAKLSFKDLVVVKCWITVDKAKKVQALIFSKISAVKKMLEDCKPELFSLEEVQRLEKGALEYMQLLDNLAAEIGKDTEKLIDCLKKTIDEFDEAKDPKEDANLAETLEYHMSIEQSVKSANKSINISFSRYEHMFNKYKTLYSLASR